MCVFVRVCESADGDTLTRKFLLVSSIERCVCVVTRVTVPLVGTLFVFNFILGGYYLVAIGHFK